MPAAQALCFHYAAAEIEGRSPPGPTFGEREILKQLASLSAKQPKKKRKQ